MFDFRDTLEVLRALLKLITLNYWNILEMQQISQVAKFRNYNTINNYLFIIPNGEIYILLKVNIVKYKS